MKNKTGFEYKVFSTQREDLANLLTRLAGHSWRPLRLNYRGARVEVPAVREVLSETLQ